MAERERNRTVKVRLFGVFGVENAGPTIVRLVELAPRPWPNGRGITRDVANRKASDGSYDWLISIAELVEDAEFSHYEGRDRIFTLVGENSVDLQISDLPPLRCNPLVPAHFPGDRPTRCILAGGPSRAFNLIVNRARMMGTVTSLTIAGNHEAKVPRRPAAVHCAAGTVMVQGGVLGTGDTLVAPQDRLFRTGETAATLLIADLWETG
ncbi:MAG: HutD/Ves family protein [Alphaproteobacteria bacterium]